MKALVFETEGEVEICTAARKCLVKSLHHPKSGAAHEQSEVLEEQAVRRLRQMTAYPRNRILAVRCHLLRIHVLPRKFRTIGEGTDGGDCRIQSERLQHLCQAVRRKDNTFPQKEQGIRCSGFRPCIPPLRRRSPGAGQHTARKSVQCLSQDLRLFLCGKDKQLSLHAQRRGSSQYRLRRLAQIRPLLARCEDDREFTHYFSTRSSMKSVLRIFAATCRALSFSPISCRSSAMFRNVTSAPGSRRRAAIRSSFALA